MISLLVAYLFEIIAWLILGCVVNPNKYLPYSVATITLLGHTQTTCVACWGSGLGLCMTLPARGRFRLCHVPAAFWCQFGCFLKWCAGTRA